MDGVSSPADGRRPSPPPDGPDPTPSDLRRTLWGVGEFLRTLSSSIFSPPPTAAPSEEPLPRLPTYNGMVFGPAMSRQEELILKQQFLTTLQQVQFAVKGLDLQPVEISDLKILHDGSSRSAVVPVPPTVLKRKNRCLRPGRGGFRLNNVPILSPKWKIRRFLESGKQVLKDAFDKDDEYKKKIEVLEQYSKRLKDSIAFHLDNDDCTEDFARELCCLVDCMVKNLKLTLQAGGSSFTLSGLKRLINVPKEASELFRDVHGFTQFAIHVATFADRALRTIGTSPLHFKLFGKEANCLLHEDFNFEKLKLNSDVYNNLSVAIGGQTGDGQAIRQLMVKYKDKKNTFSFNLRSTEYGHLANPDDPDEVTLLARLSMKKPFGKDLKSVFQMAYPIYHGRFEIRGAQPYISYGGCLELKANPVNGQLNPHPVLDISGVLGMKYVRVGGQLEYNFGVGHINAAVGMSARTKLSAVELSYKYRPGIFRATALKKLVNTGTTLAIDACYSQEDNENGGASLTVGYKHAVDPTCYYKARVGTAGASIAVKKTSMGDGNWCVKGAAQVAFNDPWRLPKVGLVLSYRS